MPVIHTVHETGHSCATSTSYSLQMSLIHLSMPGTTTVSGVCTFSHVCYIVCFHCTMSVYLDVELRFQNWAPIYKDCYEEVTTYEDFTMFAKFTKLYTRNIRRSYETICEKLTSTNYVL